MRPEAERRLREGFQRRIDEETRRYAAPLAHARQQAARFECGEVAGVGEMGQLFRGLAPGTVGKTMPKLPTVDEIIATYAVKPGRSA
jgi:hypothetical protein